MVYVRLGTYVHVSTRERGREREKEVLYTVYVVHGLPIPQLVRRNIFVSGPVSLNERMALNKAVFKFEWGDWHLYEYL